MELKKVLIASAKRHADFIAAGIPGGFDIIHASTLGSALQQLECGVDVLVCDVGFDELQMFDLLQCMRHLSCPVTFICVHCGDTELDSLAESIIDVATCSAGALSFIDMRNGKLPEHNQHRLCDLIA